MRRRGAVALASGVLLLAGCTTTAPPARPPAPLPVDPALVAQREAAGIADCPEVPLDADPAPGGLPNLVLGCLGSGRQVNLAALRGQPMVVNFWAQWCGPCRLEAPFLAEFAERSGGAVRVLGVDYADPEPALALEFAASAGWTYPHVTDPLKQTAAPVRFNGIPVTVFVDADGRILYRHVGAFSSTDQIVAMVDTYLGVSV